MNIPTPAPVLPGFVDIGAGVSPLVRSSETDIQFSAGAGSMILGGSQANLLISALKRKQGTDLLSAQESLLWMERKQPSQLLRNLSTRFNMKPRNRHK